LNVIPLRKWAGGLQGFLKALEYLRDGKVSAEKISINIDE